MNRIRKNASAALLCLLVAFLLIILPGRPASGQDTSQERMLSRIQLEPGRSMWNIWDIAWIGNETILATAGTTVLAEIVLIDTRSGEAKSLADGRCASPSPDRLRAAWIPGARTTGDVWILDLRTSQRRQLTSDMRASCVRWSPDGRRLAVRQGDEILIMTADTGRIEQTIGAGSVTITPVANVPITLELHLDQGLAWSPDSLSIAFSVYDWLHVVNRIDRVEVRSQRRSQILSIPPNSPRPSSLAYSSDGKVLLFELDSITSSQILAHDGVSTRVLTAGWSPAWYPDGKSILFVRNRTLYALGI